MEFLWESLLSITWQQLVMYVVGGVLIWLAIEKGFEPALLLPMGFGAILVNLPTSGVINQVTAGVGETHGIIQWLFEVGIGASEAMPILLFIGIGAMIDFGPLLANPKLFLCGAAAQAGIFLTILLAAALGFDMKDAASIGIIGAADGPTSILVSQVLEMRLMGAILDKFISVGFLVLVILFQDDKQRRYVSTIPYNLTKLTDESKAVPELLELGVRERGLLLYYCESTTLNADNLEYFQSLAELEDCTEEYRNSVRKQILDYYAANVQDQKLDKYLEKMDFRQYAQVDRTTLLEVLITRRMFRQAMVIVEEFGYEGLDLSCLLKMTSRMILKSDMAEDDELLALASEVYRKGKYDEVILHYLMLYRFGPLDELISIWKSARGFEMDTYDLEERILSLLIFTEDYRKEGEAVLESYVKQSGKERITGAYLTLVSYGVFVREYTMSTFIRSRLEYAFTSKWPVNLICRLALLQEISREKDPKPEYVGIAQSILEECAKENLKFAFFRKLSPELLSPYQLDDKTFVECRAVPGAKVTLFYRLDTGLGAETAYKCEPLKEMYQGIFVRTFTLFYGETLQYYFQIDEGDKDNTKKTSERSVSMKKVEGASGSKYQMLNQMLSARRLDKMQEVTDSLKDYLRQEQYVKNMFSIEKESGR